MKIIPMKTLDNPDIMKSLRQQQLLLWLLPGCTVEQLLPIMELPWMTVWDDCPNLDFATLWTERVNGKRTPYVVERPDEDPPDIRTTEHLRIYRLHSQNREASRKQIRYAERLRDKIEDYVTGVVAFVGANINDDSLDKVILTRELAPSLQITLITEDSIISPTEGEGIAYQWTDSSVDFLKAFKTVIDDVEDPAVLDLKEASRVKVKPELLEDLSDYWTLLSHGLISPQKISQQDFDGFLEGKEIWASYASGVPYRRREGCYFSISSQEEKKPIDFIEDVINKIRDFEKTAKRPSEQIRQFLLMAEPGSGVTTLLRQTAVALAQKGYPTLMKKPFSQGFGGITLEKLIEDIQDKWLQQRREKRASLGLLPVCLVLDTDAEIISSGVSLARQLSGLGRPVVLIRALERSRIELDKASNIYTLPATVTENELFVIGKHLREFCQQHDLISIPREAEWRAYYEGISRLSQFSLKDKDEEISVPPLFLIGIYPFVKERIKDKRSLEKYYYGKWKALNNSNAQALIQILAAASCYGIGIPYDALRRHPFIELDKIWMLDKETQRKVDTFIEWDIPTFSHQNWHLYIRHPAIGMLLSRMFDPLEGETPYSALLPLLEQLTTKEEDIWFAERLTVRLGGHFRSHSIKFSLETDTSLQKAARIIFKTIPATVKNASKTIHHHQGRYHIHVLHACTDALENPNSTTLSSKIVLELAQDEYNLSKRELERALEVSINTLGEPDTYIYNTMATASFNFAYALRHQKNVKVFRKQFKLALEFQENAIITGPDNGHALFQFVNKALEILESGNKKWPLEEKEALFPLVESRLVELCTLHAEKRWRNIDPIDAEMKLGSIIEQHVKVSEQLIGNAEKFSNFQIKHPEAALLLKIRQVLKEQTLKEVFRSNKAEELRQLREELKALPPQEPRTYVYLYRLYVEDSIGRLNFAVRKGLLDKLYDLDYRQYFPFRHDEAALLCQLDSIKEGAEKFSELREANKFEYYAQWFWWHEKALLRNDGSKQLRKLTLTAHNPQASTASAYIRGTSILVIYKPRQFDKTFRKGEPFTAYIHFTRHGLQAVPEKWAVDNLREMGLA